MGFVTRAFGGGIAIACAASLSGAAALPIAERSLSAADLAIGQRLGFGNVPPEQQSPDHEVPVSVTEVEPVSVDLSGLSVRATSRSVASGDLSIPSMVLEAYQAAAERIAADDPGCGLRWEVLAGIGKIESDHARGGQLNSDGVTVPRIIGPVLNGAGPVAAISDSDDGQWDGDGVWDRAVGLMQFIPGTWRSFGVDADGDGVADPHNIWDSTLSAGRYLCAGGGDLSSDVGLRAALYRYNRSWTYGDNVLSWINAYSGGNAVPSPGRGPRSDDAAREPDPARVPDPEPDPDPAPKPKPKPKEPEPDPPPDDDDPEEPDPEEPDPDTDGDGIPNAVDPTPTDPDGDADEDGILDVDEVGLDPARPVDTDGDGVSDMRDSDSDDDGIPDAVDPNRTDADGDADEDGILDVDEVGPDPARPVDTDGDGVPDMLDTDSDGDGIPDAVDPTPTDPDGDADEDGILDVDEVGPDPAIPVDTDEDGVPDMLDTDSDGDGIPDMENTDSDG